MSYIYKNITSEMHLIGVVNDSGTDVSHMPLAPGAQIEVSNTSLDVYMPHILARILPNGTDITYTVLRRKEDVVEAPVVEAPVVEAPVVEAPVVEAPVVEAPVVEAPVAKEKKVKKV